MHTKPIAPMPELADLNAALAATDDPRWSDDCTQLFLTPTRALSIAGSSLLDSALTRYFDYDPANDDYSYTVHLLDASGIAPAITHSMPDDVVRAIWARRVTIITCYGSTPLEAFTAARRAALAWAAG